MNKPTTTWIVPTPAPAPVAPQLTPEAIEAQKPKPRGFASLTPERRAEIARLGGRAAHEQGKAHTWDSQSGAEASRKGAISRAKNKAKNKIILGG